MGIKGLCKLMSENSPNGVKVDSFNNLEGKKVSIDLNSLIFKYIIYKNVNIIVRLNYIITIFTKYKIEPIFIFDGKSPIEKNKVIKKRQEKIELEKKKLKLLYEDKNLLDKNQFENISKYDNANNDNIKSIINTKIYKTEKKTRQVNATIINNIKKYFDKNDVKYIHSDLESDFICAIINKNNLCEYHISEDTDIIALGCKYLIRNINFEAKTFELYNRNTILDDLKINNSQFIDLCILLGSDYIPRTIGIKGYNILNIIRKYGSIEKIYDNLNDINTTLKKPILMNKKERYINVKNILLLNNININNYNFTI